MKKILISVFAGILGISMLMGCGGSKSTGSSKSKYESKKDISYQSNYESQNDSSYGSNQDAEVIEEKYLIENKSEMMNIECESEITYSEEEFVIVEPGKVVSMLDIQEYLWVAPEVSELIALKTGEEYLVLDCKQSGDDGLQMQNDVTGNHKIAYNSKVIDIQIQPDSQIVHFGLKAGNSIDIMLIPSMTYCLPFYLLGLDWPNDMSFDYGDYKSEKAFQSCFLEGENNMEKFGDVIITEVDGVPINGERLAHMGERVNGLANPSYIFTDKETITVGGFHDTTFVENTFSCGLFFTPSTVVIEPGEYETTKEGYFITVDSDVLSSLYKNEYFLYGNKAIFRIVE